RARIDRRHPRTFARADVDAEVLCAMAIVERTPLAERRRQRAGRTMKRARELRRALRLLVRLFDRRVVGVDLPTLFLVGIRELVLDDELGLGKRLRDDRN